MVFPLIETDATGVAQYQTSTDAGISAAGGSEAPGFGGSGGSVGGMTPDPVSLATTPAIACVTSLTSLEVS